MQYGDFTGSKSCGSCHKNIYEDHINTGHYNTSQPTSEKQILGSFKPGQNTFSFNGLSKVVMEKREDGYYQVGYLMEKEGSKSRFDITIGSGKKGQSYLSWKENRLIQLPITYFTPESTWSISPGFHPRKIAFNRVITSRCLECHSTYFETTSPKEKHPEEFDKKNIIYGIDCEKCHGPAKEHVNFHVMNPDIKEAKYIVNTGKLSRQLKLDLCGLCHSGRLTKTQPSFSFQAGDSLTDFFTQSNTPAQVGGIDVHGNQLGMLSQSKCFTASDMTCQSCHSVHQKEEGKLDIFSQRCAGCHQESKNNLCPLTKIVGNVINKNCIDCH
ncbi:MAG: multiheme c-type cytochrome, partial [Chitinophagaceae bacterium]